MRKYMCGVPKNHCSGSNSFVSSGLGKNQKLHQTSPDAFKCYARYLVNIEGFTRVASREFSKPGEPHLIINKQSKFGYELRAGKSGKKGASTNSRFMPKSGGGIILG